MISLASRGAVIAPEFVRWVDERVAARTAARRGRRYAEADAVRDELRARGVEIEDTPTGTKWRVVAGLSGRSTA